VDWQAAFFCHIPAEVADESPYIPVSAGWPLACFGKLVTIDPTTTQLVHYMDLLSARQKLVVSNMANADTPGYKAQDIDFQFEFMSLVEGQPPQTIPEEGVESKPDGNNVSLDREARMLSENAMRFNVASTLVRGALKTIRSAIDEGKTG
jgi:flagellar basal-body rod protein FlgB